MGKTFFSSHTHTHRFEGLRLARRPVRRPDCTLCTVDHNIPTASRAAFIGGTHKTPASADGKERVSAGSSPIWVRSRVFLESHSATRLSSRSSSVRHLFDHSENSNRNSKSRPLVLLAGEMSVDEFLDDVASRTQVLALEDNAHVRRLTLSHICVFVRKESKTKRAECELSNSPASRSKVPFNQVLTKGCRSLGLEPKWLRTLLYVHIYIYIYTPIYIYT